MGMDPGVAYRGYHLGYRTSDNELSQRSRASTGRRGAGRRDRLIGPGPKTGSMN